MKLVKKREVAAPRSRFTKRMDDSTTQMLERFATRISFLELSLATDEFSENNVIAAGETGTTYKATLSNGSRLAVKRLIATTPHIEHVFRSEILTLGRFGATIRLLPRTEPQTVSLQIHAKRKSPRLPFLVHISNRDNPMAYDGQDCGWSGTWHRVAPSEQSRPSRDQFEMHDVG